MVYDAIFAFLARTLVRGYRRAVTVITLVAGFASTSSLPLATIAAAALLAPTQVGARLLLLALEGRLSLRRSGHLAARLPVQGTAVLAEIGPGASLLWRFPVLYGAGNFPALSKAGDGMPTIARATALVEFVSRSSFGAIDGAIALPALVGTALPPVATSHLRSLSRGCDGVLTALVARPSRASRVSGGPPHAHLPHDRPG